jgi:X-X-X-Leu-X-X-Gly heptad repeat protein
MGRGMGGLTDLTDGVGHLHDGLNPGPLANSTLVLKSHRRSMPVFTRHSNRPAADAAEQLLSREVKCRMARC